MALATALKRRTSKTLSGKYFRILLDLNLHLYGLRAKDRGDLFVRECQPQLAFQRGMREELKAFHRFDVRGIVDIQLFHFEWYRSYEAPRGRHTDPRVR